MADLLRWLREMAGVELEEQELALVLVGLVVAILVWQRLRYLARCPNCGAWGAPRVGVASSGSASTTRSVVVRASGAVDRTRTRTRHAVPRRCRRCGHEFTERFASELRRDRRH